MTCQLNGRKVVVTGGKLELDRTIAEAVADVVIWIREWKGNLNELKQLLSRIEAQIVSDRPDGKSSQTSLWRQSMATHRSYW
jgi:hypothetical protein